MDVGRFMGMVGALIWSPSKNKYLILKRSEEKDFAGETWECGTGRVDQGEDFTIALRERSTRNLGWKFRLILLLGQLIFSR